MGTMSLNNLLQPNNLVVNVQQKINNFLRFTTFILKYRFDNHTLYKVAIIIFTTFFLKIIYLSKINIKEEYSF